MVADAADERFSNQLNKGGDRLPSEDFSAISPEMEKWTPEHILTWAIERFGSKLAFSTAFGVEGCVLMAMMAQIDGFKDAYLFNLDTGYQFAETLELRERFQEKYALTIHLYEAQESVEAMEARFGGPIYDRMPDECCRIRKVVPMKEALAGYDAWISSIRRDQSRIRAKAPIMEWNPKLGVVKINPLANWTRKDTWKYVFANNIPYNPLLDQRYTSIGCRPCTRAVKPGDDERAGRWAGSAKTECGLHVPDPAPSAS